MSSICSAGRLGWIVGQGWGKGQGGGPTQQSFRTVRSIDPIHLSKHAIIQDPQPLRKELTARRLLPVRSPSRRMATSSSMSLRLASSASIWAWRCHWGRVRFFTMMQIGEMILRKTKAGREKGDASMQPTSLRCPICRFMLMLSPPAPVPAAPCAAITSHRLDPTTPRSGLGTTASWSLGCGASVVSSGVAGISVFWLALHGRDVWGMSFGVHMSIFAHRPHPIPFGPRTTRRRKGRRRRRRIIPTDVRKVHRHHRPRARRLAPDKGVV